MEGGVAILNRAAGRDFTNKVTLDLRYKGGGEGSYVVNSEKASSRQRKRGHRKCRKPGAGVLGMFEEQPGSQRVARASLSEGRETGVRWTGSLEPIFEGLEGDFNPL